MCQHHIEYNIKRIISCNMKIFIASNKVVWFVNGVWSKQSRPILCEHCETNNQKISIATPNSCMMVSFQRNKLQLKKTLMIYNCFSQKVKTHVWVLPINGESRHWSKIMCMWSMVPQNATKELCTVPAWPIRHSSAE